MEHTFDRIRKDWSFFTWHGRFQQFWETSVRWPSMNIYDYALDNGCVVMVKWILRLCGKPGYRLAGKCRKEFPKKGNTGGRGTVTLRGR